MTSRGRQGDIKGVTAWFASGDGFLAVCLKPASTFLGFVACNREEQPEPVTYNLGYIFTADSHGHGYATEACRALLSYVFGTLGAAQVVSGTALVNEPSCRLLARLGFRETGRVRGSFQRDVDGNPIEFDGATFALTREEWLNA